jgi:hypothetical protein
MHQRPQSRAQAALLQVLPTLWFRTPGPGLLAAQANASSRRGHRGSHVGHGTDPLFRNVVDYDLFCEGTVSFPKTRRVPQPSEPSS